MLWLAASAVKDACHRFCDGLAALRTRTVSPPCLSLNHLRSVHQSLIHPLLAFIN
jgi:hypothetical protein